MNRIFRRLDKTTLLLYLYFKKFIGQKKISAQDGAVLVLADLLFGDVAMAGYLLVALRERYPDRKIVVLSKANLSNVVRTFDFVEVVDGDYLSWGVLRSLKRASPSGYGEVINVFSWKWLPLLRGFDFGLLSSHLSPKAKDNQQIDHVLSMPTEPTVAANIALSLLQPPVDSMPKARWRPVLKKNDLINVDSYLVIHVGASALARLWPLWMLEKLIQLSAKKGLFVVFTGLNQDELYMSELEKIIEKHFQSNFFNLIGKTSLLGLLEIISNADALISVDTGVIHWARFLSVPNLSVMGQSDSSLFGCASSLFDKSYCISTAKLDCQDKKTFHGIKLDWVAGCARGECPLDDRPCFSNISQYDIELTFDKLISNRSNKNEL